MAGPTRRTLTWLFALGLSAAATGALGADKLAVDATRVYVNRHAQQRIAAGECRAVHAWVIGTLAFCPTDGSPWYRRAERVVYHPHERNALFRFEDGEPFTGWGLVRFDERGMWAWR